MEGLQLLQALEGHTDRVWCIAWSPSGEQLASCSGDRTVRIWNWCKDTRRLVCSAVLEENQHRTIRACSWSPSGRCLATASFDATTAIWEVQGNSWEQVAILEGHENEVKSVAWSPSGSLIATCGRDKTVWIWEALPGHEYECVDVKYGHSQDVKSVIWHPSGEVLVSTSYDDSIKLWVDNDDEWVCVQTLSGPGSGHSGTVWGAAFSPDGTKMVSCSDDTTLRIWECHFARGFREPKWKLLNTLSGYHDMTIYSVDWSHDNLVATGCRDNGIRVLRADTQGSDSDASALPAFQMASHTEGAHAADVNCVAWHPSSRGLLASAGDDRLVKVWQLN